ncbi:30S ribosomal protein S7 [Candidatus Nasuia deltocephalinicola]|uniref:small ribosomal subunit protein uS7 n=1 Tax=Candidatus Nasuia deltocephalincola TaxID=1160784 RepID=UPI00216AC487|nr:30S ribosomal protein S7 [Candidatus Nasuia deltocephalinicola]
MALKKMSRKKKRVFRKIYPDIFYNNIDIEKFINIIMISGKKTIARNIVYKAFNYIGKNLNKNPIKIFSTALDNAAPMIESKIKKSSGVKRNYFIDIKRYRRKSLSMRWIKKYSKLRKEKYMYLKLAHEIIDASKKRGESVKKRESVHKLYTSKKNYNTDKGGRLK